MPAKIKLRILKISIISIFFICLIVFLAFNYELISNIESIRNIYYDSVIGNIYDIRDYRNESEMYYYMDSYFNSSMFSYFLFSLLLPIFIFVWYCNFNILYNFYVCNEKTTGYVSFENYRYVCEYQYKKDKFLKRKEGYNQEFFKKVYKLRDGKIDLFFNKINPKRYILGNKPTYLVKNFIKPSIMLLIINIVLFSIL